MPVIADIRKERVKRRWERAVCLDDGASVHITEETFLRFPLSVGKRLTPEQWRELQNADQVIRAREQALRLLDRRLRTRKELENRLSRNGWSADVVDAVLERLEQIGLIDDTRFARLWADERLCLRPVGLSLLRRELIRKGIDAPIVDAVLRTCGNDEDESARAIALLERRRRHYQGLERSAAFRRMSGLLARRGFDGETIYRVVHQILESMKESER
jgi:regulatory protein